MTKQITSILFISLPITITIGILFPSIGKILSQNLLLMLAILLFLNLLKLNLKDLLNFFLKPKFLLLFTCLKLIIIPLFFLGLFNLIYPSMSLAVFLLAGISTGLGAPFVANFTGAKLSIVVGTTIISSLFVPISLPTLTYIIFQENFSIPYFEMIALLFFALILPLMASFLSQKYLPKFITKLEKCSFQLSIVLIIIINYTVFSMYSELFTLNSKQVIITLFIASSLFIVFGIIGFYFVKIIKNYSRDEQLGGFISMAYINNLVVIVFTTNFFDWQIAALAAMYNLPYYIGIIVLREISEKVYGKKL